MAGNSHHSQPLYVLEEDEDDTEIGEVPNPSPETRVFSTDEKDSQGPSSMAAHGEDSQKSFNSEDMEGLLCPVCMEPWSNGGDHPPSCLPCGHLFGMSCIKKWLGQRRNSGKCPQCNKKCTSKDVRRIYGSRVVVVDADSQKRIRFLEAKCESLEKKDKEWRKKEDVWHTKEVAQQKEQAEMCQRLQQLNEMVNYLKRALENLPSKSLRLRAASGVDARSEHKVGITGPESAYTFALQQELLLDGARYFDVDDFNQVLIAVRRPVRIGEPYVLSKMSLFSPWEQDNMQLPSFIKTVRDLHISPFGKLSLLASMGRKLTVVSMESNNIVLNYDLPAAAWSCSWDINSSHYAYAGLQNGMLLAFDMRQTMRPLESRSGLSSNPVHTIYSISDDSTAYTGVKSLLTASSTGVCQWDVDVAQEHKTCRVGGSHRLTALLLGVLFVSDLKFGPVLITEAMNQGVCISLAYCPCSDNIVATYRPRMEMPDEIGISQPSQARFSNMGYHVLGSHVVIKRVGSSFQQLGSTSACVPGVRLPKSTILNTGEENSVFVSGDEETSELVLQELPSLTITQNLQSYDPICDVKYTASQKPGLLCCLSGNRMQFFYRQLL